MTLAPGLYEVEIYIQPKDVGTDARPSKQMGCVNGYYFNPQIGKRLRSRWEAGLMADKNFSPAMKRFAADNGTIPGERFFVDTAKMKWGHYDPLTKAGKDTAIGKQAAKIKAYFASPNVDFGSKQIYFGETRAEDIYSDDQLKTWMFWLVSAVNSGYAIKSPTSKALPPIQEVLAMPGRLSKKSTMGTPIYSKEYNDLVARNDHYVPPESVVAE